MTTINKLASKYSKWWIYPDPETIHTWETEKYLQIFACDDPPPEDFADTVDGFWIIDYSKKRFHLDFVIQDDKLKGVGINGHDVDLIKKHLPKWFIQLTKDKYTDIMNAIKAKNEMKGDSKIGTVAYG